MEFCTRISFHVMALPWLIERSDMRDVVNIWTYLMVCVCAGVDGQACVRLFSLVCMWVLARFFVNVNPSITTYLE